MGLVFSRPLHVYITPLVSHASTPKTPTLFLKNELKYPFLREAFLIATIPLFSTFVPPYYR